MHEIHLQGSQQYEQSTERLLISVRIQKCLISLPLLLHFSLFLLWIT